MGVRGLTTYIAANAERYLEPFELHDCDLVIDGDNLCFQLYVRSEAGMGAFGGNYDNFYRAVLDFFALLRKCSIRPWVLLDGGYEACKLKTVRQRMLGRIQFIKHVKVGSNRLLIPLLMREVFVDALRAIKVPFMRCLFEADNEIAVLARKLDCPVLSYDSDFYIHNVRYIPYVTLSHKVYRKTIQNEENFQIELVSKKAKVKSKLLAKEGTSEILPEQIQESYNYLDCSLYTIENLIGSAHKLKPEMLPLFATLLGNDYIERRILKTFYASMTVGKTNRKVPREKRKILGILRWLQHHTVQSATNTILGQIKERNRQKLKRQLRGAMHGYNCEECDSFEYFGFEEESQYDDVEEADEDVMLEEDRAEKQLNALESGNSAGQVETTENQETDFFEGEEDDEQDNSENDNNEEQTEDEDDGETDNGEVDEDAPVEDPDLEDTFEWEDWVVDLFRAGRTPRFVMDLYRSGLYINYPQVEDIHKPDSNALCYDLLKLIFALLMNGKKRQSFRYLTRCQKVTQFRWMKFYDVTLPDNLKYDPHKPKNLSLFKALLESLSTDSGLLEAVKLLPPNLRLYFLSIVYWANKCSDVTSIHVHTLIVCLMQLLVIDKHLSNRKRDVKVFLTNYKSNLESMKRTYKKVELKEETLTKNLIAELCKKVSKIEAILSYDLFINFFHINERQTRKHAEFDRFLAHTFAQLQAVTLNMFTLNALLQHPFESCKMYELYNGLFTHNVYHAMKIRTDPINYLEGTIYRYSGTMMIIHRLLFDWVRAAVPQLESRLETKRLTKTALKPKITKPGERKLEVVANDCIDADLLESSEDDGEGFSDLNNQFSQLLQIS
ncbi:protein asteroid-like [Uranotaenia lowii]|uniref:protein asteroid-like n=1 Tax=Uranotaenia lowii TaxID=190385 RepID=UPI00247A878C|nr:protein asteroid-like [Uranotaenia lowii]